jgi:hypothetical protein
MKNLRALLLMIGLIFSCTIVAKTSAKEAAEQNLVAVTIFVDVNQLTRKNLAAKKMTRLHNEFAAEGYELVSVDIYTENGDLEGFFVSYKK